MSAAPKKEVIITLHKNANCADCHVFEKVFKQIVQEFTEKQKKCKETPGKSCADIIQRRDIHPDSEIKNPTRAYFQEQYYFPFMYYDTLQETSYEKDKPDQYPHITIEYNGTLVKKIDVYELIKYAEDLRKYYTIDISPFMSPVYFMNDYILPSVFDELGILDEFSYLPYGGLYGTRASVASILANLFK